MNTRRSRGRHKDEDGGVDVDDMMAKLRELLEERRRFLHDRKKKLRILCVAMSLGPAQLSYPFVAPIWTVKALRGKPEDWYLHTLCLVPVVGGLITAELF